MHALDPRLTHIPTTRERVVSLHMGLNAPQLAIPGKPPQAAQAYLVGTRNEDQTFTCWLYLHLLDSDEAAIFLGAARQVPGHAYLAEEGEALSFLEGLGFMTDDQRWRERTDEEQDALVARLPCFAPRPPRPPPEAPRGDVALARLLASY